MLTPSTHAWRGDTVNSVNKPKPAALVQGKRVVAVAAAKRHTVVLTSSGEVLTWGHRAVTPRRVVLAGVPASNAQSAQGYRVRETGYEAGATRRM